MHIGYELLLEIIREELDAGQPFPDNQRLAPMINAEAVGALNKIKTIIENDDLDDYGCIEGIVRVFEEMGIRTENRH